MYNKFFGFKEKPFKLVPDPEYLFLSKSHEEALAHLSYALTHGDGFVEITGEVGTGKTTLCRVFLENLDESIEAAYIFNPKLDALQLLKAINDEFGIDSSPDNTKDLIDILNGFLMGKKAAGQKALVLIDEAQNLSLEVLEQLRLLSNLETTREKLLQIILVGQPELGDMLSSHKLRQLGQRITINCRLAPLTFQEAKDYIRHRISLASHRASPPFDKSAYRAIYDYASGIPRLINIACDRTLLNAFSRNSFQITGGLAREAIRELKKTEPGFTRDRRRGVPALAIPAVVLVALIIALLYINNQVSQDMPAADKPSATLQAGRPEQPETDVVSGKETASAESIPSDTDETDSLENNPIPPMPVLQNPAAAGEAHSSEEAIEQSGNIEEEPEEAAKEAESNPAEAAFSNYLKSLNSRRSRNSVMATVIKLWFPDGDTEQLKDRLNNDRVFFQESAEQYGLKIQPVATESDTTLISNFSLPAIFTFYLPGHLWPIYIAVPYINDEEIYYFAPGQGRVDKTDRKVFLQYWSGEAYILWKNFYDLQGIITERSNSADILALKKLLRELGYDRVRLTGEYDAETVKIIRDLQEKYGLHVDGLVGPFTKIALYNESSAFIKPSFNQFIALKTENER